MTDKNDLSGVSNLRLLDAIHKLEMARLAAAEVTDYRGLRKLDESPWPEGYEALVNEAQRRKLCL